MGAGAGGGSADVGLAMRTADAPFRPSLSFRPSASHRPQMVLKSRYVILETEILGEGASATVYRGLDKQECRNVAVKLYKMAPGDSSGLDAFAQSVTVFEALFRGPQQDKAKDASFDPSAMDIKGLQEEVRQAVDQADRAGSKASVDSTGIARYKTDQFLKHMDVRCCFVKLLDFSKTEKGEPGLDPQDEVLFLIFELGDASLEETIQSRDGATLSPKELRNIQWTLASMVWGLHAVGYVHLDIKPKNVMRFGSGPSSQWKLIDLDGAVPAGSSHSLKSLTFTPEYMPPELASALIGGMNSPGLKQASMLTSRLMDVWSVGMCMMEVVFLQPVLAPFYLQWAEETGSDVKYFEWLSDQHNDPIVSGDMMGHLEGINADLADLLAGMLEREPGQRFSIGRCLAHKWFDPIRERAMSEIQIATSKGHAFPTKVCTTM